MDPTRLRELLAQVAAGEIDAEAAVDRLRDLPFEDLGFATIDHHRALRRGFPEVVLGQGKTPEQIATIVECIVAKGSRALVTRLVAGPAGEVLERLEALKPTYHESARILAAGDAKPELRGAGPIAVVTAGTADQPVAEEAAICASEMGNEVHRIYDVGVAGIHRVLHHRDMLDDARVLIVVAGMEGALASVVGGLVARPVIAVPTSVGYGAAFGGVTALLGMLTSCAAGVTVVNIDNGFGAAYAASLMNRI